MGYDAKVICDSVTKRGERLTTMEVTFPRIVLSEFNTHCMISRNSASSRAVPTKKKICDLLLDPFIPIEFGTNRAGMTAGSQLDSGRDAEARTVWLSARDEAVWGALALIFGCHLINDLRGRALDMAIVDELFSIPPEQRRLNVHKQVVNRLVEPFMWQTVIATATDWSNFFALRTSENAQPEIRKAALLMLQAFEDSEAVLVENNSWHLPLLQEDELLQAMVDPQSWLLVSAGRCARVSYLTHHGVRSRNADLELAESLLRNGHMSPFEHVARAMTDDERARREYAGKLRGWVPYRSVIPNEHDYSLVLAERCIGSIGSSDSGSR